MQVLEMEPKNIGALYILGEIACQTNTYEMAIGMYKRAIAIMPDEPVFHSNLGYLLLTANRLDEAVTLFRKALELKPDYVQAHHNLGVALDAQDYVCEAIECFRKALEIDPDFIPAQNDLAHALQSLGRIEEAIDWYTKALALRPDSVTGYDNLLLALHYSSHYSPEQIYEEHLKFARMHAEPLMRSIKPHRNSRDPERRLRIGYISPDFRSHSVAYFIEPALENHDDSKFELFAYYSDQKNDSVTQKLRQYFDHWRCIASMHNEDIADLIRKDGIDILVDLAGHTRNNRLLVFALKPAPVQITWLGYPNTSGLSCMDYRITDSIADPVGVTDRFYTEKLLRMPEIFSTFRAPEPSPDVAELPALGNGYVTFGSFNNLAKITPEVIQLWADIIDQVPGSRLTLKCWGLLGKKSTRQMIQDVFSQNGISSERLNLLGESTSQENHLRCYNEIDIALDPFPYSGTTTTCDALWMGVPVITLQGDAHAARVGASQLSSLGCPEFIAGNKKDYIAIAKRFSSDLDNLKIIRSGLRQKMLVSPLMDAPRFTRNLELMYRHVWSKWCKHSWNQHLDYINPA